MKKCPACNTDEFVKYRTGSHAGNSSTVDSSRKVIYENSYESYVCDKCGGGFTFKFEIRDGVLQSLKIEYDKNKINDSESGTYA